MILLGRALQQRRASQQARRESLGIVTIPETSCLDITNSSGIREGNEIKATKEQETREKQGTASSSRRCSTGTMVKGVFLHSQTNNKVYNVYNAFFSNLLYDYVLSFFYIIFDRANGFISD